MIVCAPAGDLDASGIGGCPDGYRPLHFGSAETGFQPLTLQAPECDGLLCDLAVQDVVFAGVVIGAFAIGFASGFIRR